MSDGPVIAEAIVIFGFELVIAQPDDIRAQDSDLAPIMRTRTQLNGSAGL